MAVKEMTLKEKYQALLDLGQQLGVKDSNWKEEGGKLKVWGTCEYQLEKNLMWDKIKSYPAWEAEVVADIKVAKTDIHGVHTVVSGDTLSKLAKHYLGLPGAYMKIFDLNKDQLKDPNVIKVGQKLKIPNP
jgi:LysM repeat protein